VRYNHETCRLTTEYYHFHHNNYNLIDIRDANFNSLLGIVSIDTNVHKCIPKNRSFQYGKVTHKTRTQLDALSNSSLDDVVVEASVC